jgi:predicted transcriptional regulator
MTLDLPPDLARALDRAADEDGVAPPELVRRALAAFLAERGLLAGRSKEEGLRPDQLTSENDD